MIVDVLHDSTFHYCIVPRINNVYQVFDVEDIIEGSTVEMPSVTQNCLK